MPPGAQIPEKVAAVVEVVVEDSLDNSSESSDMSSPPVDEDAAVDYCTLDFPPPEPSLSATQTHWKA